MNIKGRHWVFIVGFLLSAIVALYNTEIARRILEVLALIGIGIFLRDSD